MKKRWIIILTAAAILAVGCCSAILYLSANSIGFSSGRFLIAEGGVCLIIVDDRSPVILSNTKDNPHLFDDLSTGDEILVLHDGIQESYPGQTGAYAIWKRSDGTIDDISEDVLKELAELGWLGTETEHSDTGSVIDIFCEYRVTYANWSDSDLIYSLSLNSNLMAVSSVQHLPTYRFDTETDLQLFQVTFKNILSLEHGYDEVPAFSDIIASYDKAFFEDQSLVLVYVSACSGTYRYGVKSAVSDGTTFCIHVEQLNYPECVTDDMAGWFIVVEAEDSVLNSCAVIDADLNNHMTN